jgi:hypothetical protein
MDTARNYLFLVKMQNATDTVFLKKLAVAFKVKHTLPILSCNPLPRNLPKRNEKLHLYRRPYRHAYSSVISNYQNTETSQTIGCGGAAQWVRMEYF